MADNVVIGDVRYMRRNPWGVVGLTVITLGIYFIVWYYKTNNHLRNYGIEAKPGVPLSPAKATLAVTLGALIIVPALVSYYNTADRILQAQKKSGAEERIIPVVALLLVLVVGLFAPAYYQSQINKVWDAEAAKGARIEV
jgi:drug/metabolite transporter (DMT)-like permease